MTETVEVQLARLDERIKHLVQLQTQQNVGLTQLTDNIDSVNKRMTAMEATIASAGPALTEYTAVKNQIIGAGRFGRWIWIGASFLLGLTISIKDWLLSWFSHGGA